MTKTRPDNIADLDQHRDERRQPPAMTQAPSNPFAPSNPSFSDICYFDSVLTCSYNSGIGALTLAARRQLLDASGQVYEDLVLAALVRAPMYALRNLKNCIEEIERLEAEQVAAAVAAMKKPPCETAH